MRTQKMLNIRSDELKLSTARDCIGIVCNDYFLQTAAAMMQIKNQSRYIRYRYRRYNLQFS